MRISDWSSDVCSSDLAEHDADDAAAGRDHHRFGEKLQAHLARAGAHRHAQADFADALGHRHQHDVHDADAADQQRNAGHGAEQRSEEHTSELQSLMRISYAVFFLKKKNKENKQMTNKKKKHNIEKIK